METEQAIAIFEGNGGSDVAGAIELALVALRERMEREKGCEHCVTDNEFHVINPCRDYSGIEISLNAHIGMLRVRSDSCRMDAIQISACPVCGKGLLCGKEK